VLSSHAVSVSSALPEIAMILLVIVVQTEDVGRLSERLIEDGFRLTRFNATGGFLAAGSAVLLVGTEEGRLPAVTHVIEETCHTRTRLVNAAPWPGMAGSYVMGTVSPVEVLVGGAVVFGVPVERFLLLGGSAPPPDLASSNAPATEAPGDASQMAATQRTTNVTPTSEPTGQVAEPAAGPEGAAQADSAATDTKLVVAVVQKDNSDAVVSALRDAGYRLTRIDTAGGFLRRGNATLLIGVEAPRLNDVLNLIHANCSPRTEPAPIQEGMPMYGATVFVLDASYFLRF
jgi:uncharacterized protein YaaQ